MDVARYLEIKIAPRAIFDVLEERRTRVRYMVHDGSDWRAVTFGAHARQIREIAVFLSGTVSMGDRAALFAANSVEWMASALAIQAAGGVMVPVYPSSTSEQATYVIRHSDAKVVFVDGAALLERLFERWEDLDAVRRIVLLSDSLDPTKVVDSMRKRGLPTPPATEIERRIVSLGRAMATGRARDQEDPKAFERTMGAISLDQPGVMLYTSGTSGPPKGVPLTHRNVGVNGADWFECNAPLLREGAVDLLWLPMSHIFGFGEACIGNALGWTSYLAEPANVLARLPEVRPDVFMSVPSVWEKLATSAMGDPDPRTALAKVTGGRLSFCLSGGAGLKR
jgi:long-chain acyl-CoA synthetase